MQARVPLDGGDLIGKLVLGLTDAIPKLNSCIRVHQIALRLGLQMIIDFRLRPPYKGFLGTRMWIAERTTLVNARLGFTPSTSIKERSLQALLAEMDEAGITMGVSSGRDVRSTIGGIDNAEVVALQREFPTRFVGCASINPDDPASASAEIDRYLAEGLKGIVVEPGISPTQPKYPSDPSLFPVYEHCASRGLPVVIMGGGNAGPDISYSDPLHLDQVAAKFPSLNIVATHGGWPFVQQIVGVAFRRPNVFVSPDMYLLNSPGMHDYVFAANGYMQDQFLFATSYPFTPLKDYLDSFLALPWKSTVLDKLLFKNAKRVLGI